MNKQELIELCKSEGIQLLYDGQLLIMQRYSIFRSIEPKGKFKNEYDALIDCFWFGNEYINASGQLEKYGYENKDTFDFASECYYQLLGIIGPIVPQFRQYYKEHNYV